MEFDWGNEMDDEVRAQPLEKSSVEVGTDSEFSTSAVETEGDLKFRAVGKSFV